VAEPGQSAAHPRKTWSVVLALASAQFIMVLDSTVMNVSIEEVIRDLDTTVTEMQLAIAAYTLTMASLMLVGGKLGDIFGRRRAFRIGLVLFGCGAGITAAAPNIEVLIAGWSITEALGAVLMIPAVAALITSNYEGRERAIAFGIIGGIAGAAAAAGPIVGGWVSTAFSWRVVFAAEVVIVLVLLLASRLIRDAPREGERPRLDVGGAALSASGLALIVLAIVRSTDWGWIDPKSALTIGGTEITPFGLSVVPFLICAGIVLLIAFARWEKRVVAKGGTPLVDLSILRIPQLRAGVSTQAVMMLSLAGVFFVLPLYLQIVLSKDPLETGLRTLPLSIGVFVLSLTASRLSGRFAPRTIVRTGLACLIVGVVLLLLTIEPQLNAFEWFVAMAVVGVGLGMVASQLGNVILSSVHPAQTSEAGGVQGTAQNLGSALGTALIGSILLTSLTGAFGHHVADNPDLPASVRTQVSDRTSGGLQFVPAAEAAEIAEQAGLSKHNAQELSEDYGDAQITALKTALGGVIVVGVLGLWFTRRLPAQPLSAAAQPASAAS
jgi:EmrB/QacA subfamily drug resistance transporter